MKKSRWQACLSAGFFTFIYIGRKPVASWPLLPGVKKERCGAESGNSLLFSPYFVILQYAALIAKPAILPQFLFIYPGGNHIGLGKN